LAVSPFREPGILEFPPTPLCHDHLAILFQDRVAFRSALTGRKIAYVGEDKSRCKKCLEERQAEKDKLPTLWNRIRAWWRK